MKNINTAIIITLSLALIGCQTTQQASVNPNAARSTSIEFSTPDPDTKMVEAKLHRPSGPGPFPAVLLMHAGRGVSELEEAYGERMAKWGYVGLVVDTYGTRGLRRTSDIGYKKGAYHQLSDVYGALEYLRKTAFVDAKRIAIIGFSRGGHTVL